MLCWVGVFIGFIKGSYGFEATEVVAEAPFLIWIPISSEPISGLLDHLVGDVRILMPLKQDNIILPNFDRRDNYSPSFS